MGLASALPLLFYTKQENSPSKMVLSPLTSVGGRWYCGFKTNWMLVLLTNKKKKNHGLDCIKIIRSCWRPAKSRGFEVRSYYHSLSSPNGCRCLGICCSDWRSLLGLQVDFFSWIAALGKILSTDNLPKRGIKVLDWCCMCKRDGESLAWTKCKKFWGMWTFYHWC